MSDTRLVETLAGSPVARNAECHPGLDHLDGALMRCENRRKSRYVVELKTICKI